MAIVGLLKTIRPFLYRENRSHTTFLGTLRASFAFPKQLNNGESFPELCNFEGEDDDPKITSHDRSTLVVLIRYHTGARLAAVAGAGAEWDLAGERAPQRVA